MNEVRRKRRTREHIIADLAVNHVERQALLCGFIIDRNRHDYGIDLEMTTFNKNGEINEGKILLQLKASDRLRVRTDGTIPSRVERKHIANWLAQPMPVILVKYDALRNLAYWLYVQSYFRKHGRATLFTTTTLPIPAVNIVNPAAMLRFSRFLDNVLGQIGEVDHDEDKS